MYNILLIGAGGALGAISRFLVGQAGLRLLGSGLPWGTFAVNIIGSLAMGLLIGWLTMIDRSHETSLRMFGVVGFLGGFTTFSAFSLELVMMIERKEWLPAFTYASTSVVLALAALMIGMMIRRRAVT